MCQIGCLLTLFQHWLYLELSMVLYSCSKLLSLNAVTFFTLHQSHTPVPLSLSQAMRATMLCFKDCLKAPVSTSLGRVIKVSIITIKKNSVMLHFLFLFQLYPILFQLINYYGIGFPCFSISNSRESTL